MYCGKNLPCWVRPTRALRYNHCDGQSCWETHIQQNACWEKSRVGYSKRRAGDWVDTAFFPGISWKEMFESDIINRPWQLRVGHISLLLKHWILLYQSIMPGLNWKHVKTKQLNATHLSSCMELLAQPTCKSPFRYLCEMSYGSTALPKYW